MESDPTDNADQANSVAVQILIQVTSNLQRARKQASPELRQEIEARYADARRARYAGACLLASPKRYN